MSEHISAHKCDSRASCECCRNLISYTLSCPFIRASFVGRVCGMVQGKTDVIGAEQNGTWKKYNCDNDYENQQPISKNTNMVKQ